MISLSGLLVLKSNRPLATPTTLFTLISFLPFSYLCYDSYKTDRTDGYTVKIDSETKTIRFGDSSRIKDTVVPYSEWTSYRITSKTKSEKEKTRYTDTIELEHRSGFYLGLGSVSVTDYFNEKEPFSRYAELNREMRKFVRILPLPILAVYGGKHQGILLKDMEEEKHEETTSSTPGSFKDISFPLRWKYTVSNAAYSFFAALLACGHLGVLLLWLAFQGNRFLWKRSLLIGFVFYVLAGFDYLHYIHGKDGAEFQIEETSSGFRLTSFSKGKPPHLESEVIRGKSILPVLHLPEKRITFISKASWEKTLRLAEQIDKGSAEGTLSALGSSMEGDWDSVIWDVSDLPMEEVTSLFLKLNAVKE
ncbi:hypothetical protein [Leptospira idonii]|uniref:Uncharacterized protein n=1 Tax=Leptospira idonii TaxID=1193500 RepID=A0A4R9M144_9LEPT|nr:hypothetical protein [Leptospira idonii]TGN19671.1 hypothetical protein EHS15_07790 [Leptospira idonii]